MEQKISMDNKYKTRNGLDVRILCVDRVDEDYPIVGLLGIKIITWSNKGKFQGSVHEHDYDLIEVKKKVYANIYWDKELGYYIGDVYNTGEEAKKYVSHIYQPLGVVCFNKHEEK